MKTLVLGGTAFLGRAVVRALLDKGHQVTLFNRGQTSPDLFPEAKRIVGNREIDVSELAEQHWDVVFDINGIKPGEVAMTAAALEEKTGCYVYVSSISAYERFGERVHENSPLWDVTGIEGKPLDGETYGPMKARCERTVHTRFRDRGLIIRPGLIVGPWDYSDRFTYWPVRFHRGGRVAAPPAIHPVRFIDVRDLAEWMVDLTSRGVRGTFNATGQAVTMGSFLQTCKAVINPEAEIVWFSQKYLEDKGIAAWEELPVWLPSDTGFHKIDISRALKQGLSFRPLEETITDTLQWFLNESGRDELHTGLTPERELTLLGESQHASSV